MRELWQEVTEIPGDPGITVAHHSNCYYHLKLAERSPEAKARLERAAEWLMEEIQPGARRSEVFELGVLNGAIVTGMGIGVYEAPAPHYAQIEKNPTSRAGEHFRNCTLFGLKSFKGTVVRDPAIKLLAERLGVSGDHLEPFDRFVMSWGRGGKLPPWVTESRLIEEAKRVKAIIRKRLKGGDAF